MADLKNLNLVEKANKGTFLELKNPCDMSEVLTDEGEKCGDKDKVKAFYLKLLGSDSNTYRAALKEMKREIKQASKGGKNKNDDNEEDVERGVARLLAKCTTECYVVEDGKVIDCTEQEMTRLYMTYTWMREQADVHASSRAVLMTS